MNALDFKKTADSAAQLKRARNYSQALKEIEQLLAFCPLNPVALIQKYLLLSIIHGVGDEVTLGSRESLLRDAIMVDEKSIPARMELAYLLYVKNRSAEAMSIVDDSIALLGALTVQMNLAKALILFDKGEKKEAKSLYRRMEADFGDSHEELLFSFRTDHPDVVE